MWWWRAQPWWSTEALVVAAATTVAILALLIVAVVLVLKQLRTPDQGPERILAERFAQGEIEELEYRRRLRILRDQSVEEPAEE